MSLKQIPGEDDEYVQIEQPVLAPGDPMRGFLPASFGRQDFELNADELYEKVRRIPLKPKKEKKPKDDNSDDDDSDDSSDDEDEYPVSHAIELKSHSKAVSSISLDSSGTRVATASHDCVFKLYDFPSMSRDHLYAFRSVEPTGTHHVHSATFSHVDSGQNVLVIPASNQAKIYTRDGHESVEFMKGDMYLRDMHNTKGHVAEITAGVWHPTNANLCATASADSTIRIWDVNNKRAHSEIMVHKSRARGGRSRMCCLAWSGPHEGGKSLLASVALDGALVIYGGQGPYTRPVMEVRDAHQAETWTGGIAFSGDGRLLVTRGQDQCIKLWDTRNLKAPVTTRTDFPTPHHPEANLVFSPNSTSILTGDSNGNLHILLPATLRTEESHAITTNSSPLVSVTWHQKLNQILCGSASGSVHVLFNPQTSQKGAKTVLTNPLRKRHIDDDITAITDAQAISGDAIMTPATDTAAAIKRKNQELRKPNMPHPTPWGKSQPDQEHIRQNIPGSSMRDEDPREALLKYAEAAEKEPLFTSVYKTNQPKTIYAKIEEEEEEEEKRPDKKKRRW